LFSFYFLPYSYCHWSRCLLCCQYMVFRPIDLLPSRRSRS